MYYIQHRNYYVLYLPTHIRCHVCISLFNQTLYLCKVFLYDIISHLSSIQLSIKSSTNHGHDVIYTSHPVLVSQQIPGENKEASLECQTCNLKNNITHKHIAIAAAIILVYINLKTFFHASQVHFQGLMISLENFKSQEKKHVSFSTFLLL